MLKKNPSLAVIGASGVVGRELLSILEEREFEHSHLELFASAQSHGEIIEVFGEKYRVTELRNPDQVSADIAFFAAGSAVSQKFAPALAERGIICIDKSSFFRLHEDIPLVVAGVNNHDIKKAHIIASPNCIVTPLIQVLEPIHKLAELSQVIIATYQAVSGAGKKASLELESQVRDLFNMREPNCDFFKKQIAFNCLPLIPAEGPIDSYGKSDEEYKVIAESKKILGLPELKIDVTCVRVPVFNGHSMAVHLATKNPIRIDEVKDTLAKASGIILVDDPKKAKYPSALDASGEDMTLVGRIRPNTAVSHGLSLWIASDNLRTGAALNAVRIAEALQRE